MGENRPGWFRRTIGGIAGHFFNFLSSTIPLWLQGRPIWPRHDVRKFITDAYEGNGLCYAATMEIATSMAEAPLAVEDDGGKVAAENPLARLLKQPNDFQTMRELMIETIAHMVITGNCYWVLDSPVFPTFMQTLPPEYVRPMFEDGQLYYEFNNFTTPAKIYPASQIIHFKEAPDLLDPLMRGMSPIVPIRRYIDIDNVLARYVDDFFHNNAIPPALLIFKNRLGKEDIDRVKEEMRSQHAQPGKYHSIGISFGDAKLERMGIDMKELDMDPVLFFVEARILQAFNVPPILLGATVAMKVSGWGSNYQEARRSFQAENLAPRQRNMEEILDVKLAAKFGPNYRIKFDLSNVLALQSDRKERREQATAAWNAGALTLNEWRIEWGMSSLGDKGDFRKPTSVGGTATVTASTDAPKNGNGKAAGMEIDPLAGEDLALAKVRDEMKGITGMAA